MGDTIAEYPNFSPLSIDHKQAVDSLTARFQPYSDFNFTSLFCWDTDNTAAISLLNGNLVVRMTDYTSDDPLYSILGDTEIDASLDRLLADVGKLELVPEIVVQSLADPNRFVCVEDRDQFDYVYPLADLVDLGGGHFKEKRNKINKFMRLHGEGLSLKRIDFKDPAIKEVIGDLFQRWAEERQREVNDAEREAASMQKLFEYGTSLNLIGMQVFLEDKLVACSLNEMVQMDYAICHFQKSILTYENVDVFLSNLVSKELKHFECKYVNWEQDLGIAGLRQLKESYVHEFFLKKYTVTPA